MKDRPHPRAHSQTALRSARLPGACGGGPSTCEAAVQSLDAGLPRMNVRRNILLAAAAGTLLQGCTGLAVTGAAVGAVAAGDRRTLGTQADDQTIEFRVRSSISSALPAANVRAVSYNRKVLLVGQATSEADRTIAQEVAARVSNVASVFNEIEIRPLASAQSSAADIGLSTRVRASIVEDKMLELAAFRITAELGVIFLMGQVTKREGERAAQLASKVNGVRKVVTFFEVVS